MQQLASAALLLSMPSSPTLQVPKSPQVQEARGGRGRRGGCWLPQQPGLHHSSYMYIYCSTVAPSCPLCFTGLLIDPAATEYWKLIGDRFLQWLLNFGRSSLGLVEPDVVLDNIRLNELQASTAWTSRTYESPSTLEQRHIRIIRQKRMI